MTKYWIALAILAITFITPSALITQCPLANMYYNGNECVCQVGYIWISPKCVQIVVPSNLPPIPNNQTTTCQGLHQVYNGSTCICQSGYFLISGICTTCSANSQWNGQYCQCNSGYYQLNGTCSQCPAGYYVSNNVCTPNTTTCSQGQYYDNSTKKCLSCAVNCQNCTASGCSVCSTGYQLGGNGVCTQNNSNSTNSTDSLSLDSSISVNTNNIYLTLKSVPTFTFNTTTQMTQFIQSSFQNTITPTVYCQQQPSPNLDLFDCLLIYPSGIPNSNFSINFSYNYSGHAASTTVAVNPLAGTPTASRNII